MSLLWTYFPSLLGQAAANLYVRFGQVHIMHVIGHKQLFLLVMGQYSEGIQFRTAVLLTFLFKVAPLVQWLAPPLFYSAIIVP